MLGEEEIFRNFAAEKKKKQMKTGTKGILCLMAFAALFTGCREERREAEETPKKDPKEFVVMGLGNGSFERGDIVYLSRDDRYGVKVDSIAIGATAEGGSYLLFKGEVETPWVGYLWTPKQREGIVCVIEPDTVWVATDSVWGTPMNDRLTAFHRSLALSDLSDEMEPYIKIYYNTTSARRRAEAERMLDSLQKEGNDRAMDTCRAFFERNKDNALGAIAMGYMAEMGEFAYSEFDSIVRNAAPAVAGYGPVQRKLELLRCVDATSAGRHYTDLKGEIWNENGERVEGRLSDLIDGKLALVDFYASWCGPCRNEIKNHLVPLWKKYKEEGLVVVGLNVWEQGNAAARKAAREKVTRNLGITYPQLVDSSRTATNTYGVEAIPQIILIDKDGTILARDLYGEAIEEAVIKALGK